MMAELPSIQYNSRRYYKIGCRKCGQGEFNWSIAKRDDIFVAQCKCGHIIDVSNSNIVKEPDPKVWNARDFV